MRTKYTPVQMFLVEKVCKKCNEGTYKPTGFCLTSSPPQYPHKCDKCGDEQTFRERYPTTGHRPIDDENNKPFFVEG